MLRILDGLTLQVSRFCSSPGVGTQKVGKRSAYAQKKVGLNHRGTHEP